MKEIYFVAVSLHGEDRAHYLQEHCPDDSMRRDVEKLLAESTQSATEAMLDSLVPPRESAPVALALSPGSQLGHYRIKQKLGAGGMGWVYEANDEVLKRPVALKVLPPGQTDAEHRHRLTREAQSASALNHPNIITVYEVGHQDSVDFIAMERVHGLTLRGLIGENGLDTRTATKYAAQIADALAAAHDANIVHRDLKPGNIMVTDRGLVKVLDFGIAKQALRFAASASQTADLSVSHTGEVVGTLSYMSPEQAQGSGVDARSDIFSFGSLLYEMLSGRRAFQEDTAMATLNAVVSKEPPALHSLLPTLPRALDRIVGKCLEKKPHDRWQHMSDIKLLLQDLNKDFDLPPEPSVIAAQPAPRRVWIAAGLGALAALSFAAGGWYIVNRPKPEPIAVLRRITAETGLNTAPAISRDGGLLAFSSSRASDGGLDIWLQQANGRNPIRLTSDPADESDPDFSPDGSRIAFRSEKNGGGIYVVPALGGDPLLIAADGRQPKFSPDGRTIVYWSGRDGSEFPDSSHVYAVDAGGGRPRRVDSGLAWARYPIWSPAGDMIVVAAGKSESRSSVDWWTVPVAGGAPSPMDAMRRLNLVGLAVPAPLGWAQNGSRAILYSLDSGDSTNLWEMPVDTSFRVSGPPRRQTLGPGRQTRAAQARSQTVTRTVFADELFNVDVWELPYDADHGRQLGQPRKLTERVAPDWSSSVSADGRQLAYVSGLFGNWNIYARDTAAGTERTLASNSNRILYAVFSGDAQRVFFTNFQLDILFAPIGGGIAEKVCGGCGTVSGVSRDGSQFIFEPATNEDLLLFDVAERKKSTLALRPGKKSLLIDGRLSLDGKWASFTHSDSAAGSTQIFIVPVNKERPAPRDEWIAVTSATELARDPAWAPSGNYVYFTAERDGFRCIWGRRLDPQTRKPVGEPFPVHHFHSATQTIRNVGPQTQLVGLGASSARLVYAAAGVSGNIWLQEVPVAK